MVKTLIIFEQIESLERYFATEIKREDVDVVAPYKLVNSKIMHQVRALCKRAPFTWVHDFWIDDWKKNLTTYDNIVVFDNTLTKPFLNYLKKNKALSSKIKIWLWNVPSANLTYLKENVDDIYCFDKEYSKKNDLKFLEQFHILNLEHSHDNLEKVDFYFIGANKGRQEILEQLAENLEQLKLKYKFEIFGTSNLSDNYKGIVSLKQKIDYYQVLENIKESRVIVEINKKSQSGLTLRALEALFYGKKLVTNNVNIKSYDFYNDSNIYILGEERENLKEFLDREYKPIPLDIVKKFSFNNWLSEISKNNED